MKVIAWLRMTCCGLAPLVIVMGQQAKLEPLPPTFYQFDGGPPLRGEVSYLAGETIFLSVLVGGYHVSAKDTVALEWKAEVFDEAGVPLVKAGEKSLEEELAPEDKDWKPKIVWQFDSPPTASCAKCRFVIEVKDRGNGEVAKREAFFALRSRSVEPSETLVIRNFRFLRSEDGEALATPAYRPGDELWARFEITGYKYGEGNQIAVDYGLSVNRPSGKLLYQEPTAATIGDKSFYPRRYVEGVLNLRLQGLPAGEYPITVEVRDSVGSQKYEGKFVFRVE
ncbi:MAG: hypothetical protein HY820_20905 [Acidobacteria bacterium]|nr:hypothetical protein [Acidobacteriota bacterium]